MVTEIIFLISGLAITILLGAKMWEERSRKPFFLLQLISHGDEHFRTLSHTSAVKYSELKEKFGFMIRKQLPLQTKNMMMKTNTFIKERTEELFGNVRDSRFIKRNGDISEFFKNMSEIEEGRIDETLDKPEDKH